jgi:hypothetical protein
MFAYEVCVSALLVSLIDISHESVIEIEEIVEGVDKRNRGYIRENYTSVSWRYRTHFGE